MTVNIPDDWRKALATEFEKPYFAALSDFVDAERKEYTVFPPEKDVFNALNMTPYENVRVVILGQDPYHDDGQAHGLAFSVRPGVSIPPSLRNIYTELTKDISDFVAPKHGYLASWAEHGVLLLNTCLTVRAHEANSHRGKGWETFTDAVIHAVVVRESPAVFILWGVPAQKKRALIDETRHTVLVSPHPSPLSARKGFFGSEPFTRTNFALEERHQPTIDWRLPQVIK